MKDRGWTIHYKENKFGHKAQRSCFHAQTGFRCKPWEVCHKNTEWLKTEILGHCKAAERELHPTVYRVVPGHSSIQWQWTDLSLFWQLASHSSLHSRPALEIASNGISKPLSEPPLLLLQEMERSYWGLLPVLSVLERTEFKSWLCFLSEWLQPLKPSRKFNCLPTSVISLGEIFITNHHSFTKASWIRLLVCGSTSEATKWQ